MGPLIILSENSTMEPQQVGRLPLTLPPAASESHVFAALQNAYLTPVGQLCDDGFQSIKKNII